MDHFVAVTLLDSEIDGMQYDTSVNCSLIARN